MRFPVDAQLPPALCGWLRKQGHEAVHLAGIGLLAASDEAIAARAEADGFVLVSKDEDFVPLRLPIASLSFGYAAETPPSAR